MYLSNCKINFSGFNPTTEVTGAIERLMHLLQAKAPSDSFLKLSIISGENGVSGLLNVVSKSGRFESSQRGIDPLNVCGQLNEDLLSKLKLWSSARVL